MKYEYDYDNLDKEGLYYKGRGTDLKKLDKISEKLRTNDTENLLELMRSLKFSIIHINSSRFDQFPEGCPYAYNFYCYSRNSNRITIPALKDLEERFPGTLANTAFWEGNHGFSTPLTEAIKGKNYEMIDFLIDNGCSLFSSDHSECHTYFFCENYDEEMTQFLRKRALNFENEIRDMFSQHKKRALEYYEHTGDHIKCAMDNFEEYVKNNSNILD